MCNMHPHATGHAVTGLHWCAVFETQYGQQASLERDSGHDSCTHQQQGMQDANIRMWVCEGTLTPPNPLQNMRPSMHYLG